jgi:hypothetical protein
MNPGGLPQLSQDSSGQWWLTAADGSQSVAISADQAQSVKQLIPEVNRDIWLLYGGGLLVALLLLRGIFAR